MRRLFSSLAATAFMVVICATNVPAALYSQWSDNEQQVFNLVNHQRDINGLSDLNLDNRLSVAAEQHSRDMADNDYFDHTSNDGTELSERILAQDYHFTGYPGENIAAGYPDAYAVMYGTNDLATISAFDLQLGNDGFANWEDVGQGWASAQWDEWDQYRGKLGGGWMGSSGHRDSILSDYFTDIGVGYYFLETDGGALDYNHYWTQDFATGDTAPVPIPPSVLLFGSGMLWVVGFFRLKKKIE